MEGISHEAASLAGHLSLGKLIVLYDDNHITHRGPTDLSFTEDVAGALRGLRLARPARRRRQRPRRGRRRASRAAQAETGAPVAHRRAARTSATAARTSRTRRKAHGEPLGADEVKLDRRRSLGWPDDTQFYVPEEVRAHCARRERGAEGRGGVWNARVLGVPRRVPRARRRVRRVHREASCPTAGRRSFRPSPTDKARRDPRRLRQGAQRARRRRVPDAHRRLGRPDAVDQDRSSGRASTSKPATRSADGTSTSASASTAWAPILNGIALHGGLIPFGGTFLVFSDYMRPAIRLAALMELPVVYVFTHDTIGLGEDGPTHQPVEQLTALRAMPHLAYSARPTPNETAVGWRVALGGSEGPTALVLRGRSPYPSPTGRGPSRRLRRLRRRGVQGDPHRLGLRAPPRPRRAEAPRGGRDPGPRRLDAFARALPGAGRRVARFRSPALLPRPGRRRGCRHPLPGPGSSGSTEPSSASTASEPPLPTRPSTRGSASPRKPSPPPPARCFRPDPLPQESDQLGVHSLRRIGGEPVAGVGNPDEAEIGDRVSRPSRSSEPR